MNARLINLWDYCRSSFWFIPALMALLAVGAALGACRLDAELADKNIEIGWLMTTAPAARSTLSSLAAATIALAGVVFSITVVTLSIASSQFGSRIVRNVMTENVVDVVIGQYVGTSLYCLLVLRAVRHPEVAETGFVPHVATAGGLLLGVVSLAMLIGYIHYVATAIQAPKRVEAVARELNIAVDAVFPDSIEEQPVGTAGDETIRNALLDELGAEQAQIESRGEGYVEGIDIEHLVSVARRFEAVLALDCKPGQFAAREQSLVRVWFTDPERTIDGDENGIGGMTDEVNLAIVIGARRTPRQDVGFAAWQLVEIAVRALSPGINDPFTAINCIDRLGAALGRLAERANPPLIHRDEEGDVRVLIAASDRFADVLHDSFHQIRQYGVSSTAVSIRLLEALIQIARRATRPGDLAAVRRQADSLRSAFAAQNVPQADQDDFDARYAELLQIVQSRGAAPVAGDGQPADNRKPDRPTGESMPKIEETA